MTKGRWRNTEMPADMKATTKALFQAGRRGADNKESRAAFIVWRNECILRGWPLQALADAAGCTREAIRVYRVDGYDGEPIKETDLPQLPRMPTRITVIPKKAVQKQQSRSYQQWRASRTVPPEVCRELRRLHVIAYQLRGSAGRTPARNASNQLNLRLVELYEEGYSLYSLAKAVGVASASAIGFRMARTGYPGLAPCYYTSVYNGTGMQQEWESMGFGNAHAANRWTKKSQEST